MAVTRSTAADRKTAPPLVRERNSRSFELVSMLLASMLVIAALSLTFLAKAAEIADAKPVYLSDLARAEQLIPYLQQILPTPRERQVAGQRYTISSSRMEVICQTLARSGVSRR